MSSVTPVRRALLVLLLPLALVAVGCGGSNDGSEGLPTVPASKFEDLTGKKTVEVTAVDNAFEPRYITVSPGTTVTFTNTGRNPHNVVPAEEGQFETVATDELQPAMSASITLTDAGTYPYYCSLHGTASRGMNGRIIVEEG